MLSNTHILIASFFVICCVLLTFEIHGAHGIMCYQCNSAIHPGCESLKTENTSSEYYKICEEQPDKNGNLRELFCRKMYQHVKDVKGTTRIIRKCGWEKSLKRDCYSFEDDDHKEIVCQCFHDACNGTGKLKPATYLYIFMTVLITVSSNYFLKRLMF